MIYNYNHIHNDIDSDIGNRNVKLKLNDYLSILWLWQNRNAN